MKLRTPRTFFVMILAVAFLLLTTAFLVSPLRVVDGQTGTSPITQDWVNQKLVQWKPSAVTPLDFGVVFEKASYNNIAYPRNTPAVVNADLAMLESTGAKYIRIDIGYDAWLKGNTTTQAEIASLVNQIHGSGRFLIVADAAAESYRNSPLSWSQFKTAWVQRVQTLASLYHPDYYIVIKEPGWYATMVSDALTNPDFQDPNQWLNLTKTLVATVQAASPSTVVGVAVAADSLVGSNQQFYVSLLRGETSLSGVSFIGFDIYTASGFANTQNYIDQYGSGSKAVWIAECWSGDGSSIFDSTRSTLDATWMQAVYYFAELIHAKMLIPFYTNLFASYQLTEGSSLTPAQMISLYQDRTQVYFAYQSAQSSTGIPITSTTRTVSTTHTVSTTNESTTSPSTSSGGKLPVLEIAGVVVVVALALVVVAVRSRGRR